MFKWYDNNVYKLIVLMKQKNNPLRCFIKLKFEFFNFDQLIAG